MAWQIKIISGLLGLNFSLRCRYNSFMQKWIDSMTKKRVFLIGKIVILLSILLSACNGTAPTATPAPAATLAPEIAATEIPITAATTLSESGVYEPIDASLCQMLQEVTSEALGVDVSMETDASFADELAGESGKGCRLTAQGDGSQFTSPQDVVLDLKNTTGLGWTEQINYEADGSTGSSTALTRDMGLMLIQVNWKLSDAAICPTDQPVEVCDIQPSQKLYSIEIDLAQYKATFSLDGHWQDSTTGFSLDLAQEWKIITGKHEVVAQSGNKIDSLDQSITGTTNASGAVVTFQSSFTDQSGTAEITVVDTNTIQWKITQAPEGEYYLPAGATLVRK